MKSKFYKNLNLYRVIVQTIAFLFIILVPFLVFVGYREIIGNYYSFTIFGLEIADPAVSLQAMLLKKQIFIPILIAVIVPILVALLFGRVFCSWACPYSALQDFLDFLLRKFFNRKTNRKPDSNNPDSKWYWSILSIFLIIVLVLSIPIITFTSFPGIISINFYYLFIGISLSFEFFIVLVILALEVYLSNRFWCKFICPVGAVLAIFRTKYTMKIVFNKDNCDCGGAFSPCNMSCPLNLNPKDDNLYPHCLNCGKCLKSCERTGSGALEFKFKGIVNN